MRNLTKTLCLSLALLGALTLTACDQGEQTYDIEPGENLSISGPSSVTVPNGEATFYIFPFTIDKTYDWSVDGPGDVTTETRRGGEFLDVSFSEPGTYTVSIDDGEYTGSMTVAVSYTDVASQAGRMDYGTLATLIDAVGLSDTLGTEGPFTLLAPTDSAFVAAFDTTAEGDLDLPADSVLTEILQYHVVTDSLTTSEIEDSETAETLLDSEVTFDVSSGEYSVIDNDPDTDPAAIVEPNIPASNGVVHGIDSVLMPSDN